MRRMPFGMMGKKGKKGDGAALYNFFPFRVLQNINCI